MEVKLGGERLGSGNQMKVEMHNFERSTFNQNRKWISTMCPGLLIPCLKEIGTNGDKFEIDIASSIRTLPTIAPLFGSFKFQCDIFAVPMRLYNGLMHNNAIKIGMKMNQVLFPKIEYQGSRNARYYAKKEKWFSHPSSLVNYLGVRDLPTSPNIETYVSNASLILAYYDIFKNYYANKQEDNAWMVGNTTSNTSNRKNIGELCDYYEIIVKRDGAIIYDKYIDNKNIEGETIDIKKGDEITFNLYNLKGKIDNNFSEQLEKNYGLKILAVQKGTQKPKVGTQKSVDRLGGAYDEIDWSNEKFVSLGIGNRLNDIFNGEINIISITNMAYLGNAWTSNGFANGITCRVDEDEIEMIPFPLENIDKMRVDIMKATDLNRVVEIKNSTSYLPYKALTETYKVQINDTIVNRSKNALPLYGLVTKTYQSDQFNNWIANTNNIQLVNEISSVKIVDNEFTMDSLIMAKKVYNMLNRIAMSGGTWQDWQEAVYSEQAIERAETPIYCGGMSCEIVFEEVVQTGTGEDTTQLGNLGGKGITTNHQGGNVIINCNEPMMILGIASITPRIIYSQGNWWFNDLKNIDELHKPSLDGIGFQDLLLNGMVGATDWEDNEGYVNHLAIGKQTAWLNYQTAVDEAFGNFALKENQMYMTLNRNYNAKLDDINNRIIIDDMTTYIEPTKYNYPFAQTELTAQNFWVQLGFNIKARRKMSAKQIPNL